MSRTLTIHARRAVLPDGEAPATVVVRDGVVVSVGPYDASGSGGGSDSDTGAVVTLADDEVLLPGLVDSHVHLNDPGRSEWEGFETGTRAAAAGGVTTVVDMPLNSLPSTVSVDALETKRRRAEGRCAVDVAFWGGAVPSSIGDLAPMSEAGAVGFKCFLLDSGVPEFAPLSPEQLLAAATAVAAFDGLLLVHAEDAHVIASHAAHQGDDSPRYADFLGTRPPQAETTAIDLVIDVATRTGCRVHVVHLSSAEALPSLVAARAAGLRLTVETCPHYLTLSAEEVGDGQTQFKCCPPVREASNAEHLWEALRRGDIDVVVSDHSPSPPELKALDTGSFSHAWGGIASLQLGLSLVWTEGRRRGFALAEVVDLMSRRTADLVGLPDKGRIAPGAAADLVVFAPDAEWTVDATRLQHRHPVTPYDGRTVSGLVRTTYLAGEPVDLTGPARGRLLTPPTAVG